MSAEWQTLAGLPLAIERVELEGLAVTLSSAFTRRSTVVHLHGGGCEGVGEDVTYDPDDHEALQTAGPPPGLAGEHTLASFSERLAQTDLFTAKAPANPVYRRYRAWAFESAALDLALRQAATTLHAALRREPRALRFVVSLRLGEPPSLQPVHRRLQIAPQMLFKLDPTPSWDTRLIGELAAMGVVESVDLKGFYEGTSVDNPPDPDLYRRVIDGFPDAWIEDPRITAQTAPVLAAAMDRVTWDAPIHSVAEIEALERRPRCINIKPSRIGTLRELLAVYAHCEANGIACYGGGQSELGPGRGQIQYLACMFHPDAPNDVAPSGWNLADPPPDLPGSPLPPAPSSTGFRWVEQV